MEDHAQSAQTTEQTNVGDLAKLRELAQPYRSHPPGLRPLVVDEGEKALLELRTQVHQMAERIDGGRETDAIDRDDLESLALLEARLRAFISGLKAR